MLMMTLLLLMRMPMAQVTRMTRLVVVARLLMALLLPLFMAQMIRREAPGSRHTEGAMAK
jgi:hypothetical protein